RLADFNQRLTCRNHFANLNSGYATSFEGHQQPASIFSRRGEQQAAGRLWIVEKRLDLFGNSVCITDHAFGKLTVGLQSSGDIASLDTLDGAWQSRDLSRINANAHTAA